MGKSRSRLAADWFTKLRVNAITQEVEHEDVDSSKLDGIEAGANKYVPVNAVYTPNDGQVDFYPPGGYVEGSISVHRNGVKLVTSVDFTAVGGLLISLVAPCTIYDVIEVVFIGASSTTANGASPIWSTVSGLVATITSTTGITNPVATLVASAPNGDTVSYFLREGDTLPAGLELDAVTGDINTINGTSIPTLAAATSQEFYVNAVANSDQARVTSRLFKITRPDNVLDGSTEFLANTSAEAIKTLTGTTTDGLYWIIVNGTARQVHCNMSTDGGGWMRIWDLTDPARNTGTNDSTTWGDFVYDENVTSWFGSTYSHSRIAYRMQNNMSNGATSYYAWTSFATDVGSNVNNILPVTPDNQVNGGRRQITVSSLNVISNHPSVVATTGGTGRLEIWEDNYGTDGTATTAGMVTSPYTDGDTATYDYNDAESASAGNYGYGSFQVHNIGITTPETVIGWNAHRYGSLQSAVPDVGFGNNVVGNPDYAAAGNPDWTFAANGGFNFRIEGYIK